MNKQILRISQKTVIVNSIRRFLLIRCMRSVDKSIVESLERLALVDFSTEAGVERLKKSIEFADKLSEVDTTSIEPLINTVYERNENVRPDVVTENTNREQLMALAPASEEFYYVAPLGTFSRKESTSEKE